MTNEEMLNEASKRFKELFEYTTNYRGNGGLIGEEDKPQQGDDSQPDMGGEMPGGDQQMPPAGDQGGMPGGDMPDMQGGMPGSDMGQDAQGGMQGMGDAMQGGDMQQGGGTPEGLNPQDGGMPGGDISDADFEGGAGPDDDVVDITELTDAQEETEEKVEKVGDKFDKVLDLLGKWQEKLDDTNEKIEKLHADMEKRNPTQIEKMSLNTAKGYPFNVQPEEYWKEKEATSNYRVDNDNNGVGQGQYTITKNDLNGATDWASIAKSLDDDDLYHQTIANTMPF